MLRTGIIGHVLLPHLNITIMNRSGLTFCWLLAITLLPSFAARAASDTNKSFRYEDKDMFMRLVIRSKEQLTGFYTGRGFPKTAIGEILKTCYITPIVKNKSQTTLWIEPDTWHFSVNGKPVNRIKRSYWTRIWKKDGLSLAHQSTFGWTLMPETRNLQPDESVGGSIAIPMQTKPFTLVARFNTRPDKSGKPKIVTFENVSCKN